MHSFAGAEAIDRCIKPTESLKVPHLMQKYSGSEEEMYERICEKLPARLLIEAKQRLNRSMDFAA